MEAGIAGLLVTQMEGFVRPLLLPNNYKLVGGMNVARQNATLPEVREQAVELVFFGP